MTLTFVLLTQTRPRIKYLMNQIILWSCQVIFISKMRNSQLTVISKPRWTNRRKDGRTGRILYATLWGHKSKEILEFSLHAHFYFRFYCHRNCKQLRKIFAVHCYKDVQIEYLIFILSHVGYFKVLSFDFKIWFNL